MNSEPKRNSIIIIIFVVLFLAICVAAIFIWIQSRSDESWVTVPLVGIVTGTVDFADLDKSQVGVAVDGVVKVGVVTQATQVMNILVQKDSAGNEIQRVAKEVGLNSLPVGATVDVSFRAEENGVLLDVRRIDFVTETDDIMASADDVDFPREITINGQIVKIETGHITLIPHNFDGPGAQEVTMTVTDDIQVYRVGEIKRSNIPHARTRVTLDDVQIGNMVAASIDTLKSTREEIVISELIVSDK